LVLDGEGYGLASTHGKDEVVEAVPKGAVPLKLARLWRR